MDEKLKVILLPTEMTEDQFTMKFSKAMECSEDTARKQFKKLMERGTVELTSAKEIKDGLRLVHHLGRFCIDSGLKP